MSEELFFAVKTIGLSKRMKRTAQTLLQAVNHNRRETQKERGSRSHIDPARSHLNRRIAGPALPADVVALAQARMAGAGYKPLRHDYTQAYELLFSLPAGTSIDTAVYFAQCLQWAVAQFGLDNILSADEHHDEGAPHLHVLVLPMAGVRYLGSKLIDRVRLASLRDSFAGLALSFGLKEPARRLHGAMKEVTARMVLAHLESTQDAILRSALWFGQKQDIERNPARYAALLGLVLPERAAPIKKVKTLAELVVSKGKGPKYERADKPIGFAASSDFVSHAPQSKPIGFENDRENHPEKIETIPVLVSAPKPLSPLPAQSAQVRPPPPVAGQHPHRQLAARPPAIELPEPQIEEEEEREVEHDLNNVREVEHFLDAVRVRDEDYDPALYDPDTGEYFRPPPRPARRRQAADAWVKSALTTRTTTGAPRYPVRNMPVGL